MSLERLEFLRKHYRGEIFDEWLARCRATTFAHGAELVRALGTPRGDRPGMTDNVRAAEEFLRVAESIGIVVRVSRRPTLEQNFFGVGGMSAERSGSEVTCGYGPGVHRPLVKRLKEEI